MSIQPNPEKQHPIPELGTSNDVSPPRGTPFPIVAIGASAGGLEAFLQVLRALPPETGMAFVFIQHLDPHHESQLQPILAGATQMPVHTVEDGLTVVPNALYVLPPNAMMVLRGGALYLTPREPGIYLPIDTFFRSLATEQASRSIGVVLSGTASDGSQGLLAIKGECGVTIAQDEISAKFSGMPRSAVATGAVDFILSPAQIANELARLGSHRYIKSPEIDRADHEILPEGDGELKKLFGVLQAATGVDFTHYKRTTIRRRIGRRMIVHRLETLAAYVAHCQKAPEELQELYRDLLINVTSFFREPATFESLKALLRGSLTNEVESFRVWVPGCATGEEVYSLSISLHELIQEMGLSTRVQLFGTDISEMSLERARNGIYSQIIAQDVSPDKLERFFKRIDSGYQINKSIRENCIFARQDLTRDPPFSHLDLVSCRNVLIYLDMVLQRKILPIFHYSLNPGGFLLLGGAEAIGLSTELFEPIDRVNRIFARKPGPVRFTMNLSTPDVVKGRTRSPAHLTLSAAELQKRVDRIVQDKYTPAGVVVNSEFEIVQFRGHTSAYLDPSPGQASLNLLRMARESLIVPLRRAMKSASEQNATVTARGRVSDPERKDREVILEITPIRGAAPPERYFLVVFNDGAPAPQAGADEGPKQSLSPTGLEASFQDVQRELAEARSQLATFSEDHAAHLEELQAANEEIRSANEELQSTNEELGTTKEELQSANEELTTVNEELRTRNDQLSSLNDDLTNLLSTVNIPIVIVDNECRIRRFTTAAEGLLGLTPVDVGHLLVQIHGPFAGTWLEELVRRALKTLNIEQEERQDENGKWYSVGVRPYRTLDNRIAGALLAFIDIDPLKRSLQAAEQARDYAESLIETVREPLMVLDADLKVRRATSSFYEIFQVSREETEGRFIYSIGNGQWNLPRLRELLTEALFRDVAFLDFEVEHDFPYIGKRTVRLNGRRIPLNDGAPRTLLLAIEDITERKHVAEMLYRRLFESATDGMLILDAATGVITDVNPHMLELTGYPRDQFIGIELRAANPLNETKEIARLVEDTRELGVARYDRIKLRTLHGRKLDVEIVANTYLVGALKVIQCNIRDITERERVHTALRESERRFRLFVESVQDYALFQFNLDGKVTAWNPGAERLLRYREDEIVGQPAALLFTPEDVEKGEDRKEMETARREGRAEDERWHIRKDGTRFWSSGVVTLVRDDAGHLRGYAKVMRDITARKKSEEELRAALGEKEVLIKEIHHRVKNNLQVITSLLNLQSSHVSDPEARETLEQTSNRVRAIATIHDLLYRSGSLARVDMEKHVQSLANDLYSLYGVDPDKVVVTVRIHEVELEIEHAIPCTLIINELLLNAFKYAFPKNSSGGILVVLERAEGSFYCLSVKDTGVGFPPEVDFRNTQTLGMQLINIFVDQLQGSIKLLPGKGTHLEIIFPASTGSAGS